MSRLAATFSALIARQQKALIPFVTAGDPGPELTVPIMHALVAGGADVIELGVPFSDPMADGPTIQRASERALAKGVRLRDVLAMTRTFRMQDPVTPVVLMGYVNPIERMGTSAFADAAADAGVDGVLVVDLPPEEYGASAAVFAGRGLDPILLLAPTSSPERIDLAVRAARGYLYYVSLKGVTGARHIDTEGVARMIARIRSQTALPIGVGFGIRDGATAAQIARTADAVVIGSRIVEEIERSAPDSVLANVEGLLRSFREAIDQVAEAAP
jgi:tryptophan synthase alpha chain